MCREAAGSEPAALVTDISHFQRTVSLENRLYEVPLGYARKRLELRYFSLDSVEAYYNGESIGQISEVNLTANSRTFRGPRKEDER